MTVKHTKASSLYGADWVLTPLDADGAWDHSAAQIILLQEIRRELKGLRRDVKAAALTGQRKKEIR